MSLASRFGAPFEIDLEPYLVSVPSILFLITGFFQFFYIDLAIPLFIIPGFSISFSIHIAFFAGY